MIISRVRLLVEGMTCDDCAHNIREELEREPGIHKALVSWRAGLAEVAYDPGVTDEDHILKSRVFRSEYSAEPLLPPRCC